MIYPKFIKKGDIIGVTATSDGVNDELDIKRFENAKVKLQEKGYDVIFTDNVFKADSQGRSSLPPESRISTLQFRALS